MTNLRKPRRSRVIDADAEDAKIRFDGGGNSVIGSGGRQRCELIEYFCDGSDRVGMRQPQPNIWRCQRRCR
ncbi:hypothetical protein ACW9HF_36195 [Nocardia gipuzkoensis]